MFKWVGGLCVFGSAIALFNDLLRLGQYGPLPIGNDGATKYVGDDRVTTRRRFVFKGVAIIHRRLRVDAIIQCVLFVCARGPRGATTTFEGSIVFACTRTPGYPKDDRHVRHEVRYILGKDLSLPYEGQKVTWTVGWCWWETRIFVTSLDTLVEPQFYALILATVQW